MKMVCHAAFWLLVVVPLLSGCWNRKELSDLNIILAMGVDYEGDKCKVTIQTIAPSQTSKQPNGNRSAAIVYSATADTFSEALRKISTKEPRFLYPGHLRILLISEKVARHGITDAMNLPFRDPHFRHDFYVVITREYSPEEVLSLVTPFEAIPAIELFKSLVVSEKQWAPTNASRALDVEKILLSESKSLILTGLTLTGDVSAGQTFENARQPKPAGEYIYQGLGVFKGDKLIGWLNESDSKTFGYVNNLVKSTVGKASCPNSDDQFVSEVKSSTATTKALLKDGEPAIHVKIDLETNLVEVPCDIDLTKEDEYLKLQIESNKQLKQIIENGIRHVQQNFGSDIYGFGEVLHRKYPKHWREWKKDWPERFRNLPVEIDTHIP